MYYERQFFQYNHWFVAYVLLLSCTATCEVAFSEFSSWGSKESLYLQLLFSGTFWVPSKVWGDCLGRLLENGGLSMQFLLSTFPILLKLLTYLRMLVRAWGVFSYQFWMLLLAAGMYVLSLNGAVYKLTISWTVKAKNIYILFRHMLERCAHLWRNRENEKLYTLYLNFTNSIKQIICNFTAKEI